MTKRPTWCLHTALHQTKNELGVSAPFPLSFWAQSNCKAHKIRVCFEPSQSGSSREGWQARQRRAGKPSKWHEPNYKAVTCKHLVSAHLISDQTLRHHGTNKIDGEKNKSDSRLMTKSFHLFFCIKCRQNPPKTPDQARRLSQVMGPSSSIHWHKCRANTLK